MYTPKWPVVVAWTAGYLLTMAAAFWLALTGKSLLIGIIITAVLPLALGVILAMSKESRSGTYPFNSIVWVLLTLFVAINSLDDSVRLLHAPHHSIWDICSTLISLQVGIFVPNTLMYLIRKSIRYPLFGAILLLVPALGMLLRHFLLAPPVVGVLGGLAVGWFLPLDLLTSATPANQYNKYVDTEVLEIFMSAGFLFMSLIYIPDIAHSHLHAGGSALLAVLATGFLLQTMRTRKLAAGGAAADLPN